MISCIIENDHNLSPRLNRLVQQSPEEPKGGSGIEPFWFSCIDELTIIQADSSKISDNLACGMMEKYRIFILRRHPHTMP